MAKKKAAKQGGEQGELNGMPGPDEVGKAAMEYVAAVGKVVEAKEAQNQSACRLAGLMRAAKRREIKIEGMVVKITHVDKDVIKVTKPKDK